MRDLDGNYINAQGDALTRLQVAYQAEQNRQQLRAQTETVDNLRKLREQVNEMGKKDASGGPQGVKDDQGSASQFFQDREKPKHSTAESVVGIRGEESAEPELRKTHIDIRI